MSRQDPEENRAFIGRWPLEGGLLPDELLSSYLVRAALANGVGAYQFGSLYWKGQPIWDRDIDRDPDPVWLADLARHSGVDHGLLAGATLHDLRRALGRVGPHGDTPFLLSASIYHRVRRRHGLQYCPACLREGTAWYRRCWRLGFMLVCDRHGAPLRDSCPSCGAPVIPHRVWGFDVGRCHGCDRPLTAGRDGDMPSDPTVALQNQLVALVMRERALAVVGPFPSAQAITALRTLIGLATRRYVLRELRPFFGLRETGESESRLTFEHARWSDRAVLLETVAAWIADWPESFRRGARAAGLTRRSFARLRMTPMLAAEVALLAAGQRRRPSPLLLDDPALLRLRRHDISAYRAERARRLLRAAGR